MDKLILLLMLMAIIAYYFIQFQPTKTKPKLQPLTSTKETQTNPVAISTNPAEKATEQTLNRLISSMQQLNKELK